MKTSQTVYEASRNPYPTWLKYADERDHLEKWLRTNINELCPVQQSTVLDIGCGLGEATARVIKILDEKKKNYTIAAIEPVPSQVRHCVERFSNDSRVSVAQSTLEDYQGKTVDLAVAVHMLYYVPNLANAVSKICSLGKKSLIVHHGERGINTVHQAFPELVKKGAHIISTYHDVEKEMEKMERKYRAECLESRVDIRPAHDANNPEGRDLIRFFLEQPQVSESTYRRVSNFLKKQGNYLVHDVGLIVCD